MTSGPTIPGASFEPAWTGTEPLIGWRVWQLAELLRGPTLMPAAVRVSPWPARAPFRATCRATWLPAGIEHPAPDPGCRCGIYASDSLESFLAAERSPAAPVIGQVALWGRVIEHRTGWRAEYAYPSRVRLVCGACLRAHGGIGAPVVAWRCGGRRLGVSCADHAPAPTAEGIVTGDPDRLQGRLLSAYAVDLLPTEPLAGLFAFAPTPTAPRTPWRPGDEPAPGVPPDDRSDAAVPGAAPRSTTAAPPPVAPPPVAPPPRTPPPASAATGTAPAPGFTWRRRALGLAGRAAVRLGQVAFAAAFLWIGCADAFTVVDVSAPATHARDDAPVLQEVLDGLGAAPVPSPDRTRPTREDRADRDGPRRDGRPAGDRRPRFAIVCGAGHGTWIELVRCGNPRGELLGFARNPPERACPAADAMTRRDRFSVCWFASSHGSWLAPDPSSASPFRRDAA
jgi:hypothetical protein